MIIYANILVNVILIDMFCLWLELFTHGIRKGNSCPYLCLIEHGQGVPQIKLNFLQE